MKYPRPIRRYLIGSAALGLMVAACGSPGGSTGAASTTSAGGATSTGNGGAATTSTSSVTTNVSSASSSSSASSASSSSSSSSSTGTGGGGGGPLCTGGGPTIDTAGSKTQVILQGVVLTSAGPIVGQVLISGNTIACVATDCSAQASGATVVTTHGVISPGLIDTHNHILFDIFDEDDWAPMQTYTNHDQWPNDPRYKAMVDAKQYLAGQGSSVDYACEMDKYGELKELIAGTTSIQTSPGTARTCYGSVARTIDTQFNDLGADTIKTATVFPSTATADGVCSSFAGMTGAYVVHIAEGVDATAHNEFQKLSTVTTTAGCLYDPKTTIVHGTALDDADFTVMAAHQMSLAWSPRSNVFLYGAGTDMTKTTDVAAALAHSVNVAIAPDWSIGGSQNMLDEMRYADQVDNARFGNLLGRRDIWRMATVNAANALGLGAKLGTLEVGKRADIAVFAGDAAVPFDAVLAATPREVTMAFVDGRLLYGDAAVQSLGPDDAVCEPIDICCRSKVACIAETTGTATDKLGQTLAEITQTLSGAMTAYDAMNLTQWKFAPIAPLVKCN